MPTPLLFSPLTLRDVTLRNRIAISPMCTYGAAEDGRATDWHLAHLGARAIGGAGLVIAEATAVAPEGRISSGDLGLWDDGHIAPLARIASLLREQGAAPGIQLAHAGRKGGHRPPQRGGGRLPLADGGWTTIAPSPLPFTADEPAPVALDAAGLARVIADFRSAARRAVRAGFTVIEVHAAHGYLLHQFLSPIANRRTDDYGGSLENRLRLPLHVVEAVRAEVPDHLPVLVRVSATDWVEGGWDLAQTVVLAQALRRLGVDLVDTSSGGQVPQATIPIAPGYQVPFAEALRRQAGIATGAVGLITRADQAEKILSQGHADLILIGRESLRDPHWPLHAAAALGYPVAWPAPYARAAPPVT